MDESLVSEFSNFKNNEHGWNLVVCHINYPNSVKSSLLAMDILNHINKFKNIKLKIIFISSIFGLASYYKIQNKRLPKVAIHLNDEFCSENKNFYDLSYKDIIVDKFFKLNYFNKKKIEKNIYTEGFNPIAKKKIKDLKIKKIFLSFNKNVNKKKYENDKQSLFNILRLLK